MTPVDEILEFWFGPGFGPGATAYQERWFRPDPAFDAEVTARFAELHGRAVAEELDRWGDQARPCLALVLVLDQFPRNMFRASPRAFASDGQALAIVRRAIAHGLDRELPAAGRLFLYLPFQHSEAVADQRRSVELSRTIATDPGSGENLAYALRHLEVIERFGRFPHRNAVLGRPSTSEEEAFLKLPGSSFGGDAAVDEAGAEA